VSEKVRFAGTVAAFASRISRRQLTRRNTLEMRILVKIKPDVGVTGFAHGTPDILAIRLWGLAGFLALAGLQLN
jgi:hypothetical protein